MNHEHEAETTPGTTRARRSRGAARSCSAPPSRGTGKAVADSRGTRGSAAVRHLDHARRQFFAHAGGLAVRYRISPCDVIEHLESARAVLPGRIAAAPVWIEDLVLATACSRGVSIAWTDLANHIDPSLRRAAASRLPEPDATAFVALFHHALRHRSLGATPPDRRSGAPSLRTFAGHRSLESWLVERLLAHLDWATPTPLATPVPSTARCVGSGT